MSVDNLIRELDILGVQPEIEEFIMKIEFNTGLDDVRNKFSESLEYKAALEFNDNSIRKIKMVNLHQSFHLDISNPYPIRRLAYGYIIFDDYTSLKLGKKIDSEHDLLTYAKPNSNGDIVDINIGSTLIRVDELRQSPLPLIQIITSHAVVKIKKFLDESNEEQPEKKKNTDD